MLKQVFLLLLIAGAIATSCSKDDVEKKTEVTVLLKDGSGNPLSGWTIYAFDEISFSTSGASSPNLADYQAATDSSGKAVFGDVGENSFITDDEEVFRFVVYYTRNSSPQTKVTPVTIKKGESKSFEIVLN